MTCFDYSSFCFAIVTNVTTENLTIDEKNDAWGCSFIGETVHQFKSVDKIKYEKENDDVTDTSYCMTLHNNVNRTFQLVPRNPSHLAHPFCSYHISTSHCRPLLQHGIVLLINLPSSRNSSDKYGEKMMRAFNKPAYDKDGNLVINSLYSNTSQCYVVYQKVTTWFEAMNLCDKFEGNLVHMSVDEEIDLMSGDLLLNNTVNFSMWLGLTRQLWTWNHKGSTKNKFTEDNFQVFIHTQHIHILDEYEKLQPLKQPKLSLLQYSSDEWKLSQIYQPKNFFIICMSAQRMNINKYGEIAPKDHKGKRVKKVGKVKRVTEVETVVRVGVGRVRVSETNSLSDDRTLNLVKTVENTEMNHDYCLMKRIEH
ncbi:hypothetical protein HELRODRAFT_177332 [Helobdella robusta]|uniref:C-type lectin domain-containing protein n=1 Tax=Helobdella robusta TaxID=6412 RepID=T1FBI5_HELRO|nr:hypothetical protein HELRODRAFT_177332 [Helobdella robusta]ESN98095.1 hypothetical protein HELRODRAFT_177332 [Helobdella robusta]